jgi:hypothetical protein
VYIVAARVFSPLLPLRPSHFPPSLCLVASSH